MFNNFPLAGLTIEALTAQVIGFLNNAFVVGAILAALALPFAARIAQAIQQIVVGGVPQAHIILKRKGGETKCLVLDSRFPV